MKKLPKERALTLLKKQLQEIEDLMQKRYGNPEFEKWKEKTRSVISNLFGENSTYIERFISIRYRIPRV